MTVTITGVNDLMRVSELNRLVADFVGSYDAMAVERFDGEETSAERMAESIQSLPFLTERKLVVLREPSKQKSFAESLGTILKNVAETTDLIIYEPKLDKRGSYYKTLKNETDFREFNELDGPALLRWAASYAKDKSGDLNSANARLLLDRIGPNQQLLKSELDKLLTYSDTVDSESIRLLTEPLPQSTVFELLDSAFSGNAKRTMELYHEQRSLGIEPQALIAMLAWQLHAMALVKTAGTRSVNEVAAEAKLNPFVVRKNQSASRKLTLEQLKKLIARLLELDIQLKSVSIDADEALELYLLQLAGQ